MFNGLKKKLEDGQCITRSDLFPVLLTPLMSGTMKMCKRICLGMDYLHSEQVAADKDEIRHMEAAFYALAIKFLNRTDLEKVKEKMRMTLLGQMLMEDGIKKGGMTKLISLVMKKMKKEMSPADIAEVLEEEQMVINRIYSAVTDHPDENEDAIYDLLYQQRS